MADDIYDGGDEETDLPAGFQPIAATQTEQAPQLPPGFQPLDAAPPQQAASQLPPGFQPMRRTRPPIDDTPESTGAGAFGRGLARGVATLPGTLTAAGVGAELGSVAGPVGAFVGGLGGALVGSGIMTSLRNHIADALGLDTPQQREADVTKHPYLSQAGELSGNLPAFGPSAERMLAQRVLAGGIFAGQEAGSEYIDEGKVDPVKVGIAGAAGVLAPKTTEWGETQLSRGTTLARKFLPGRPGKEVTPEHQEVRDAAHVAPPVDNKQGLAPEQTPPSTQEQPVATIDQVRDQGNDGHYGKVGSKTTITINGETTTVTTGDQEPSVTSALAGQLGGMKPVEKTPAQPSIVDALKQAKQAPQPSLPQQLDMSVPGLTKEQQAVLNDPVIQQALQNPQFSTDKPVPLMAGASEGNSRVTHIDPRVPKIVDIDGQQVPLHWFANVHEQIEKLMMEQGLSYSDAHTKWAEPIEDAMVKALGINLNKYNDVWNKLFKVIGKSTLEEASPDLFKGPYEAIDNGQPHLEAAEDRAIATNEQPDVQGALGTSPAKPITAALQRAKAGPTPPPAEGVIRLYRGAEQNGNAAFPGSSVTGGWFTTDLAKAKLHGKVSYLDIPKSDRETLSNFIQGHGGADEFITDNEAIKAKQQPYVEGAVQPEVSPTGVPYNPETLAVTKPKKLTKAQVREAEIKAQMDRDSAAMRAASPGGGKWPGQRAAKPVTPPGPTPPPVVEEPAKTPGVAAPERAEPQYSTGIDKSGNIITVPVYEMRETEASIRARHAEGRFTPNEEAQQRQAQQRPPQVFERNIFGEPAPKEEPAPAPAKPEQAKYREQRMVNGVQARDAADLERKQGAIAAAKAAFDKYPPENDRVPTTLEDRQALIERAQAIVDHATEQNGGEFPLQTYRPRVLPPEMNLLRQAQRLVRTRNPDLAAINQFVTNEKLVRGGASSDVQAADRIKADTELQRGKDVDVVSPHEMPGVEYEVKTPEDLARFKREEMTPEQLADAEGVSDMTPDRLAELSQRGPQEKVKQQWEIDAENADNKTAKLRAAREAAGKTLEPRERPELSELVGQENARSPTTGESERTASAADVARQAATLYSFPANLGRMLEDESGALYLQNVIKGIRGDADYQNNVTQFHMARTPRTLTEQYAATLSNWLHALVKGVTRYKIENEQRVRNMDPKLIDPKAADLRERIIYAKDEGKIGELTPDEQNLYNKNLKPIDDENDALHELNTALAEKLKLPENFVGPKLANYVHLIAKGHSSLDPPGTGVDIDPVSGAKLRNVGTKQSPLYERHYIALERAGDKARFIASVPDSDGKFVLWKNGKGMPIVNKDFTGKLGEEYTVDGDTYKVDQAHLREIEDQTPTEYYHDAVVASVQANNELKEMAEHLKFLDNTINSPAWLNNATKSFEKAKEKGWQKNKTKLPFLGDWYMDKNLKYVMDDFTKPGWGMEGLDDLRRFNQQLTKSMFWLPTAHLANVAAHWFGYRGFDWLPMSGGYRRFAQTVIPTILSTIDQSHPLNRELDIGLDGRLDRAAGTIMPGIITEDTVQNLANIVGMHMEKDPLRYGQIVKTLGMNDIGDLVSAIYRNSRKIMWGGNDMMFKQLYLENKIKHPEWSREQNINDVERHFPNYRVGATVMGSRLASQVVQDNIPFIFGRYHFGVWNSYANVVNDLVKGSGEQRKEAVGKLMALGILGFILHPLASKAAQYITGNEHAETNWRGPLAIPAHVAKALRGEEDITTALRNTLTLAPLVSWADELYHNRDYAGRPVFQRGDVQQAGQGSPKAMGRVAIQGVEHAARNLVAPIGTAEQAIHNKVGLGETLENQVLDISSKTPAQFANQQRSRIKEIKAAATRMRRPPGAVEKVYDRTVGR